VFSDVSAAHKLNWLSTVRGRVGATFGPALLYLTGGAAFGEVERSARAAGSTLRNGNVFNTFAGSHFEKSTKDGWTLGGGIEGQVMTSWSVKAEYLYVDLGRTNDSFNTTFLTGGGGVVGSVAGVRVDRSDIRDQIFRVGLNYHPPGQ
jgi:outer membrane immunogenic protein